MDAFPMLLVCPKCSARYLLSSIALGDEGREVRCAKCDHEWYQGRDDLVPSVDDVEDVFEDIPQIKEDDFEEKAEEEAVDDSFTEDVIDRHLDEEPIPEGVKPRPAENQAVDSSEQANVPALAKDVLRPPIGIQAKLTGYAAALMVFGVLLAGGVMFKQQIVSSWLPAAAIYELAGIPVSFKGEKLVMESLAAKIQKDVDGRDFLLLEGRVINLTNKVQQVPELVARLRSTNGEDGDSWHIETPLKKLEPGESFTFKSDYANVPRGVGSVNLGFTPAVTL